MLRCLGMRRRRATCRIRRQVVFENGSCSAATPPRSVGRVKIVTALLAPPPRRYCPTRPWRKMCVTAPRYRVQGPRVELLEHGLPCRTSGNSRAYGTILLCLTVAFFVGRLRWLRLPLSSLLSPFYGWGPGALRVNWYPLGRGLLAFSIFSACRAVAWVFFSLPPAPSPN